MSKVKALFKDVKKDFYYENEYMKVLNEINLYVNEGEFVSIIGPSGCGKSTIFHLMTKIVKGYEGEIEIDGISLESYSEPLSYMSQKDLLMPWRKLIDNLRLPLEIKGIDKNEANQQIIKMLPDFGLDEFQNAYPNELSGGMRQRAALLRTFLIESELMLLDEPFAALDAISRSKMQKWLLDVWNQYKRTVLFITHDIDEAIFLSDRIYVLSNRPAFIKKEIKIEFDRPRNQDIMVSEKFLTYKKELMDGLEV